MKLDKLELAEKDGQYVIKMAFVNKYGRLRYVASLIGGRHTTADKLADNFIELAGIINREVVPFSDTPIDYKEGDDET